MTMESHSSTARPAKASAFVRVLAGLIEASGKTQRRIAEEIGYDKPNIITMFKQGTTRVPFDKVAALAGVLRADRAELLRLWLADYEPHFVPVLEQHFGDFLSANEREWVDVLRRRFPAGVPAVHSAVAAATP